MNRAASPVLFESGVTSAVVGTRVLLSTVANDIIEGRISNMELVYERNDTHVFSGGMRRRATVGFERSGIHYGQYWRFWGW